MTFYTTPGVKFIGSKDDRVMAVIKAVCDEYGVSFEEMKKRNKHTKVIEPRQLIMYLLAVEHIDTLKHIGELFRRDHTTVIHNREHMKDLIKTEPELSSRINKIKMKAGL